jgi:hypothetical protein
LPFVVMMVLLPFLMLLWQVAGGRQFLAAGESTRK